MIGDKEGNTIFIPVYNGGQYLNSVLTEIDERGYLGQVKIIDDASVDETPQILKRWSDTKGLAYESMKINGKKIASVKKVLEKEYEEGTLPEYVVLHDADSYIKIEGDYHPKYVDDNDKTISALEKSIAFMEKVKWDGMGLKDIPIINKDSKFIEKLQYKEYIWDRAIHYRLGKKDKMRCIPGAGGIYKSKPLLEALESHSLRHDGDDMETTVLLQKLGYKVGYYSPYVLKDKGFDPSEYPEIIIETKVPDSFRKVVKQRIRWNTGAIETYLKEGKFHLGEMKKGTRLGAQSLYEIAKLVTYPGWFLAVGKYPEIIIPVSIVATGALNTFFTFWNPENKEEYEGKKSKMIASTLINFLPLATYTFALDTIRVPGAYAKTGYNYVKRKFEKDKPESDSGDFDVIKIKSIDVSSAEDLYPEIKSGDEDKI